MATVKKTIGRLPVYKGDWVAGSYSMLNQVTYLGSTFQSKIDNNTAIPATVVNNALQVNANWSVVSNGTAAYLADSRLTSVESRATQLEQKSNVGIINYDIPNDNCITIDFALKKLFKPQGGISIAKTIFPYSLYLHPNSMNESYETDFIMGDSGGHPREVYYLTLKYSDKKLYVAHYNGTLNLNKEDYLIIGAFSYALNTLTTTFSATLKVNGKKFVNGVYDSLDEINANINNLRTELNGVIKASSDEKGIMITNIDAPKAYLKIDYPNRKLIKETGGIVIAKNTLPYSYYLTTSHNRDRYETDFILNGGITEGQLFYLVLKKEDKKLYVMHYKVSEVIKDDYLILGMYSYINGELYTNINTDILYTNGKYISERYVNGVKDRTYNQSIYQTNGYTFFQWGNGCPFNIDTKLRKVIVEANTMWIYTPYNNYNSYQATVAYETEFVEPTSAPADQLFHLVLHKIEKKLYLFHYSMFVDNRENYIVLGSGNLVDFTTFVCNGIFKVDGVIYRQNYVLSDSDPVRIVTNFIDYGASDIGCVDYQEIGNADYSQIIMYGQSLSQGYEAPEAITTTAINGNYMIGDKVSILQGNGGQNTLFPLVATISSVYGENPIVAATNSFSKLFRRFVNKNHKFIATSCGKEGRSIERLSKEAFNGENYYNSQFIKSLDRTKLTVDELGKTVECNAIVFMQGEYNYTNLTGQGLTADVDATADKDAYKALLSNLKNNMQADIMSKYNQASKPLFFIYQTSGSYINRVDMSITMAQFEFAKENEDVILLNPAYQVPDYGGGHLSTNGYRWYGEFIAKSMYNVFVRGKRYNTVMPKNITVEKNTISIDFYVPVRPLVFDTYTKDAIDNNGFRVLLNGADVTFTTELKGDIVTLKSSTELKGDIEIIYAGNGRKGSGNLRDSDTYRSMYNYYDDRLTSPDKRENYTPKDSAGNLIYGKAYPMYNWCSNFYKKITL